MGDVGPPNGRYGPPNGRWKSPNGRSCDRMGDSPFGAAPAEWAMKSIILGIGRLAAEWRMHSPFSAAKWAMIGSTGKCGIAAELLTLPSPAVIKTFEYL